MMIKKTALLITFKIHIPLNISNWLLTGSSYNNVNQFLNTEVIVGEDKDDEKGNDSEFVGVSDLLFQLTIASIR
jgi:hypothetical protein